MRSETLKISFAGRSWVDYVVSIFFLVFAGVAYSEVDLSAIGMNLKY